MTSERIYEYEQATGILYDEGLLPITHGYSGFGEGKNNPDMQHLRGVGPIPRGTYTALEPKDDPNVGHYAMRLVPDPSNMMYGRDDFYMHGDSSEHPGNASHGCVIMPLDVRKKFWSDAPGHRIRVTHG